MIKREDLLDAHFRPTIIHADSYRVVWQTALYLRRKPVDDRKHKPNAVVARVSCVAQRCSAASRTARISHVARVRRGTGADQPAATVAQSSPVSPCRVFPFGCG